MSMTNRCSYFIAVQYLFPLQYLITFVELNILKLMKKIILKLKKLKIPILSHNSQICNNYYFFEQIKRSRAHGNSPMIINCNSPYIINEQGKRSTVQEKSQVIPAQI